MRQAPSTSPEEHLEARYQGLIDGTLAEQGRLVDVTRRIQSWYERAPGVTPNTLLAQAAGIRQRLDALTRERVEVVRAMEKRPTIEDMYPRIRSSHPLRAADADASSVAALFDGAPQGSSSTSLSAAEARAFSRARGRLGRELGYAVEQDDAALVLRRGRTTFRMLHFAFPSRAGLGGNSRISHLAVHAKAGRKDVLKFSFDRGWDAAAFCTDGEALREVDRVAAAFG